MNNTIVLKKVSVKFDQKKILDEISFGISPHKPFCIVGRGSSGKSTLLKVIMGLVKIDNGTISINNIPINDKKIYEVYNSFGVVFQKDALFDSLTVWQNVMFKSLGKFKKNELLNKTFKILKEVGLERNDAFLVPSELSGGMRKRVAIARAISHRPKFLLLDEPTAGLDPIKTNVIFKIINDLSRSYETTLIVVTSDLKGAIKYFSEIVALKNSKIDWIGSVKEIKKGPTKYVRELFKGVI